MYSYRIQPLLRDNVELVAVLGKGSGINFNMFGLRDPGVYWSAGTKSNGIVIYAQMTQPNQLIQIKDDWTARSKE